MVWAERYETSFIWIDKDFPTIHTLYSCQHKLSYSSTCGSLHKRNNKKVIMSDMPVVGKLCKKCSSPNIEKYYKELLGLNKSDLNQIKLKYKLMQKHGHKLKLKNIYIWI